MGTLDKRELKLRRNRRTVRADDLLSVLRGAGFDCRRGGEGHWSCRHADSGAWCNVPEAHGRGDQHLLRVYVDRALEALDQHRAWVKAQAEHDGPAE